MCHPFVHWSFFVSIAAKEQQREGKIYLEVHQILRFPYMRSRTLFLGLPHLVLMCLLLADICGLSCDFLNYFTSFFGGCVKPDIMGIITDFCSGSASNILVVWMSPESVTSPARRIIPLLAAFYTRFNSNSCVPVNR